MKPFHVVIPARYDSVRLPGKPLATIAGRPMIRWVWEKAVASEAASVTVAVDHEAVAAACRSFGASVVMTRADHASGTDRISEVADRAGWPDDALVVNLQGDEPLMPPAVIRQVADLLVLHPEADMATLGTPIHSLEEYLAPQVVKLVADAGGAALYFSRAPVPWHRDGAPAGPASQSRYQGAVRHLGIYGYRVGALSRLSGEPACRLEEIERLEQLRALWSGMRIQTDTAVEVPPAGVDTPEDLERVNRILAQAEA
ncbi:MAG: 3-deoxy-manno-octulosonate cytidylyltransferase [Gammaproteobacteria bacterium]